VNVASTSATKRSVSGGWDEVVFDTGNGDLKFLIASVLNFTENLDGRYTTTADVTALINATAKTVFSVTLPSASTVAGRIALAVEGTDYPTGWVLTDLGLNIGIGHGLGRWVANVTVFAKLPPTERQQLFNTAAYNGITSLDDDNLVVTSLATILKDIVIYIVFE